MLHLNSCKIIGISAFMIWLTLAESTDVPCAARSVANRSVLCVCTADHCDTITRDAPVTGRYVSYVSSEAGLRFNKTTADLQRYENGVDYDTIAIYPTITYQTIIGFGGAVTDAAGINWKNLTDSKLMQHLIESYCGDSGIQYNMLRVPIGGTDFSTHPYAYNELPENDLELTNFTLAYEDFEYKIPMIKACMKAASAPIHIVSATWSPPVWMKTNNDYRGFNRLKKEYLQTYADYHYKFIQKYAEQDIPVWAISTTNEPIDGTANYADINKLGWTLDYMGEWIVDNLGPTIRNSSFKDVKLLAVDDQRYLINLYWNTANLQHAKAATAAICKRFVEEKLDMALIQEPWINGNTVMGLNSVGTVLYNTNGSRPRACILFKKSVRFLPIPSLCTDDNVAAYVELPGSGSRPIACSAYLPGEEADPTIELANTVTYCQEQKSQLLVGSDCNAHHTSWGSTDTNSRGAQVTDTIKVDLGSWSRAEDYVVDIMENLSNNVIGWIDWNMCLNPEGGPSWTGAQVDSPIIVNAEAGEFYKQPMFYAMGHFSKFVPRGSQRIQATVTNKTNIQNLAFLTPNNTVVIVLYNAGDESNVRIHLGDKEAVLSIEAKSFTTIEMLNE